MRAQRYLVTLAATALIGAGTATASEQAQSGSADPQRTQRDAAQQQTQQEQNRQAEPQRQPAEQRQGEQTVEVPGDPVAELPETGAAEDLTETMNTAMLQQLLTRIHAMNQMEIKAGHLAEQKGTTDRIRRYGERLAMDHQYADKQVMAFARQHDVPLPEQPQALPQQMQQMKQMLGQLEQLSGAEFDQKFLQLMVKSHEFAVNMLGQKRQQLPASDFRGLLSNMVPILKQHKTLAEHLQPAQAAQR